MNRIETARTEKEPSQLKKAMKGPVYGWIVSRFLDAIIKAEVDEDIKTEAIDFIAETAVHSEELYRQEQPELKKTRAGFSDAIVSALYDHRQSVKAGEIHLMPEQYRTSKDLGEAQVRFANERLGLLRPEVQRLLSDINYNSFTGKTMRTGVDLLEDGTQGLEQWSEKDTQASMPHLVLSNLAMGSVAQGLLGDSRVKRLKVLDTGSGTGTTLAGTVLGIEAANTEKPVQITGIESNQKFFGQLDEEFSRKLGQRSREKGVSLIENEMIQGDILEEIENMTLSGQQEGEVLLTTANYVWHRLPMTIKRKIVKKLAEAENVVISVADLVKNASLVNRGYFNLRDNGLLNCGNMELLEMLEEEGFTVIELNEATKPRAMNEALAQKIGAGTTTDSFFYVAAKGPLAIQAIQEWN